MIISNSRSDRHLRWRRDERNPVTALDSKLASLEVGLVADDHPVVHGIKVNNIERTRGGNAQAFALADRVKFNAVVLAKHASLKIDNVPLMFFDELRLLEKASVVFVGHETNLHALLLVGGLQVAFPRDFARVVLGQLAEREDGARKLVLAQ